MHEIVTCCVTTLDGDTAQGTRIDSRVRWAETGTAIYFDTYFNDVPQYPGMYAYDAVRKQIRFFYTSADAELSEGQATAIPNGLSQAFTVTDANGTSRYTSTLVRTSANAYEFSVYREAGGSAIVTVRYERQE